MFIDLIQLTNAKKTFAKLLLPMFSGVITMIFFVIRGICDLSEKQMIFSMRQYNFTLYVQTGSVASDQITLLLLWAPWLETAELSRFGMNAARKSWICRTIFFGVVAHILLSRTFIGSLYLFFSNAAVVYCYQCHELCGYVFCHYIRLLSELEASSTLRAI